MLDTPKETEGLDIFNLLDRGISGAIAGAGMGVAGPTAGIVIEDVSRVIEERKYKKKVENIQQAFKARRDAELLSQTKNQYQLAYPSRGGR